MVGEPLGVAVVVGVAEMLSVGDSVAVIDKLAVGIGTAVMSVTERLNKRGSTQFRMDNVQLRPGERDGENVHDSTAIIWQDGASSESSMLADNRHAECDAMHPGHSPITSTI